MKFGVKIMPRDEVLDTQGRVVKETLNRQGFNVKECKVGKFVTIDVDSKSDAEKVASTVLCNPLIEKYELMEI